MKCSKEIILEMEMIKERPFTTSMICVQGYAAEAGFHFNFKVAELGVCVWGGGAHTHNAPPQQLATSWDKERH